MDDSNDSKKTDIKSLTNKLLSTKFIITAVTIFFVIAITVMIVESCKPRKGTIAYGLCSSFLEQHVTFPHTIRHTSVEQYPKSLRIYFTYTDAFGQYQFEMTECAFSFHSPPGPQIKLDRVFFNYIKEITEKERVPGQGRLYAVKQDVIDLFNQSKSAEIILMQEPDLTLPQHRPMRF